MFDEGIYLTRGEDAHMKSVDAAELRQYREGDAMTTARADHPDVKWQGGHVVNVQVAGNAADRLISPTFDLERAFGGEHRAAAPALEKLRSVAEARGEFLGKPPTHVADDVQKLTPAEREAYQGLLKHELELNLMPQSGGANSSFWHRFEKKVVHHGPNPVDFSVEKYWVPGDPTPSFATVDYSVGGFAVSGAPIPQFRNF